MTDTTQEQEDKVLRRMLATKPKPHKPIGNSEVSPHEEAQPRKG